MSLEKLVQGSVVISMATAVISGIAFLATGKSEFQIVMRVMVCIGVAIAFLPLVMFLIVVALEKTTGWPPKRPNS